MAILALFFLPGESPDLLSFNIPDRLLSDEEIEEDEESGEIEYYLTSSKKKRNSILRHIINPIGYTLADTVCENLK